MSHVSFSNRSAVKRSRFYARIGRFAMIEESCVLVHAATSFHLHALAGIFELEDGAPNIHLLPP